MVGKEELGECIPTSFQRNILWILFNAVRIWWDYKYGVLQRAGRVMSNNTEVCHSMYCDMYALVTDMYWFVIAMYWYVLACTAL